MKKVILVLLAPLAFVAGLITAKRLSKPEKVIEIIHVPTPISAKESYNRGIDDWNYNNPDERRLRWDDTDVDDTLARIDKYGAAALNDPVATDTKRLNRTRERLLTIVGFTVAIPTTVFALLLICQNDIEGGLAVALLMPPVWVAAILLATSFRGGTAFRWWVRGIVTALAVGYCLFYFPVSALAAITAAISVVIAASFDWLSPLPPRWKLPKT